MTSAAKHRTVTEIEHDVVRAAFELVTAMRRPGGSSYQVTLLMDRLVELKREHDTIPLYVEPSTQGEW
jgi:hypothetical protein